MAFAVRKGMHTAALWLMSFTGLHIGFGSANAQPLKAGAVAKVPDHGSTAPRLSASIFYSGHSLTDNPLPDDVAQIARSLGTQAHWNQQNIPGSSLKKRTRGSPAPAGPWAGYRQGKNREGEGMDVVRELRQPQTLNGARYDTLVATESHWLLDSLRHEDTVRFLRHFHDRLIEGNPQGRTYFYESWLDVADKANPQSWIAHERAAAPVWGCISARINQSLEAEGRGDRINRLPAATALAALIERATQKPGVAGVTGNSVEETVNRLIKDDVHLTRLGVYYMALVTYAHVYARSPQGAWAPVEVSEIQARALQDMAWELASRPAISVAAAPSDLAACQNYLRDSFCGSYYGYMRRAYWNKPQSTHYRGTFSARLKQWKETLSCKWALGRDSADNPFEFNRERDRLHWHAAP